VAAIFSPVSNAAESRPSEILGSSIAPAPRVIVSDFNADGVPDLARVNDQSTVSVFLGQNGTYPTEFRFAVGAVPRSLVAADFNGDGILDLAVANKGSRDVSVLLGRGDGSFQDHTRVPIGEPGPDLVLAHDFNGDGFVDLAAVSFDRNAFFVLLGNGDGTFQTLATVAAEPGLSEPGVLSPIAPLDVGANRKDLVLDGMDRQIMAPTSAPGAFLYSIAADLWSDDPLLIYVEQLQAGMLLTSLNLTGAAFPSRKVPDKQGRKSWSSRQRPISRPRRSASGSHSSSMKKALGISRSVSANPPLEPFRADGKMEAGATVAPTGVCRCLNHFLFSRRTAILPSAPGPAIESSLWLGPT
jgi:hypothetical protein